MTEPAVPRDAATVLLLRDSPFEVLMMRRNARGTFPDAVVFPGGVVDPSDLLEDWDELVTGNAGLSRRQQAVRIAAIRETWEEVGVLVGSSAGAPRPETRGEAFLDVVRSTGGRLGLDELHYLARWVTPEGRSRRFDTRFYLVPMPEHQEPVVDGGEAVSLEWITPTDALERAASGAQPLLPPTRLNLARLAESTDLAGAIAAAAARERFIVHPRRVEHPDGNHRFEIPEEAGYHALD